MESSFSYLHGRTSIFIATFVMALVGCAGLSPKNIKGKNGDVVMIGGYRTPDVRGSGYYALLAPLKQGWKVINFGVELPQRTEEDQEILFIDRSGKWVQPAYEHLRDDAYFSCSAISDPPASKIANVKIYSPCGRSRFVSVNLAATAGRTVFALPLTLGMAVGTNRVIDVDQIQEALKSTGLLEGVQQSIAAEQNAVASIAKLDRVANELGARAKKSIEFDVKITDLSGFFTSSPGQLAGLVKVQPPDLGKARRDEYVRVGKNHLDAASHVAALDGFSQDTNRTIESLAESYELNIQCGAVKFSTFDVNLECADRAPWSGILRGQKYIVRASVLRVHASVLTIDFNHSDGVLQVRANGRLIELMNISDSFLEIREISCYVDGEISTMRWASGGDALTLPPQAELRPQLRQADICRGKAAEKLKLPPLRLEEIKGRNLRFGIAVKYRKAGDAADRTFFRERALPLDSVVRDSI